MVNTYISTEKAGEIGDERIGRRISELEVMLKTAFGRKNSQP